MILFKSMYSALVCLLVAGMMCITRNAHASNRIQEPNIPYAPKNRVCYFTNQTLNIDGVLDEDSWQQASWSDAFVDISGDLTRQPEYETRFKILWDDTYFYIGCRLEETHLWSALTRHDTTIFHDNALEVFIDPDEDTHFYAEYQINARGEDWDLIMNRPYRDGGWAINHWELAGLRKSVSLQGTLNQPADTDTSWTIELAIPWKTLRDCSPQQLPPKEGDQLRLNIARVQWPLQIVDGRYQVETLQKTKKNKPEHYWVWSAQGIRALHYPEMWGIIQFTREDVSATEVPFRFQMSEQARWALRMVYYRQRDHFSDHGKYAKKIKDLDLEDFNISAYKWPPDLDRTDNCFEAILESEDGSEQWHINQQGCIWQNTEKISGTDGRR